MPKYSRTPQRVLPGATIAVFSNAEIAAALGLYVEKIEGKNIPPGKRTLTYQSVSGSPISVISATLNVEEI